MSGARSRAGQGSPGQARARQARVRTARGAAGLARGLALIERRAACGGVRPTHTELADASGLASGRWVVDELAREGAIAIERDGVRLRYRVLRGPQAGAATAWTRGRRSSRTVSKPDAACGHTARPCLTCGADFMSTGAHHRMCDPCRARHDEAGVYGAASDCGGGRRAFDGAGA